MASTHLLRAKLIYPIIEVLREIHAPVHKVLEQAHIPFDIENDEELLIAGMALRKLMAIVERDYKMPALGYRIVELGGLEHISNIVEKMKVEGETLFHCLQIFCESVNAIVNEAKNWTEKTSEGVWLCHQSTEHLPLGKNVMEQYVIAVFVSLVRIYAGNSWRPQMVWFERLDATADQAEMILGTQVFRGQSCTKVFIEHQYALKPNPFKQKQSEINLEQITLGKFKDTLQAMLAPHFKSFVPSITDAALITGKSKRSIQRYLQNEGLSYRDLIGKMRFDIAKKRLSKSDDTVVEIAADLGYSSIAHFTRAFKRWQGMTPSQFRQKQSVK
ncbi:helix-turn-helix domain-containing protein [Thalassotalea psychrophila]|uniref:Helix-turn-helix domain-containing protein n=1 Tax=Thalassotalea psychrophila TaxID=3065647 RepID=A0ABY9TZG3_9GAMM|nr:helix-turn-helix domain-containing protein [Colwelliaceae bacterium SQ149]